MSVRLKLILILSLVLAAAFVSTSLLTYFVSTSQQRTSDVDIILPLLSDNVLTDVQRDLMMPIDVASVMAHDIHLKNWAIAGELDADQTTAYLREIKEAYGFFTTFFVSDRTGQYYYYNGTLKTIHPDDPHDVWYYDFKDKNTDLDLDVDTDEASDGTLTVFINHRVLDQEGEFLGVVGVGLSMRSFSQLLFNYQVEFDRLIYMIDSRGLVMAHPDTSLVESESILDIDGIREIANAILAQDTDAATYEFIRAGERVFLEVRYFPQFDWYLLAEHEARASLGQIRSSLLSNLAIGLLATCAVIFVVVIVVNRFQRRLEVQATVDPLTGAFNRRHFSDVIAREVNRARRHDRTIGFLMIDINRFKEINDRFGHAMGDRVLQAVATIIQNSIRDSDILIRYGGDEFLVVLPETTGEIDTVKERIRAEIARRNKLNPLLDFPVALAIGSVNWSSASGQSVEGALRIADELMYEDKRRLG